MNAAIFEELPWLCSGCYGGGIDRLDTTEKGDNFLSLVKTVSHKAKLSDDDTFKHVIISARLGLTNPTMMPSSNELGLYKRRLYTLTIEGGTFEVIEALIEKSTSLAGEGIVQCSI